MGGVLEIVQGPPGLERAAQFTGQRKLSCFGVMAFLTVQEEMVHEPRMIAVTDDLLRAGIRLRFPEAGEEEFVYPLLRAKYGQELARKVYGRSA